MRTAFAGALLAAVLAAAAGCAPQARHRVLSFFFDGVPAPTDEAAAGTAAPATAAAPARAPSFKHAPYAKRQCNLCHHPSTNNLMEAVPALCFRCHDLGQNTRKHLHGPVLTGSCRICHDPHSARNAGLLVVPPREMCFFCHNPEDVYRNRAHADQEASCTRCHNPHADNRYFLRDEYLVPAGGGG